MHHVDLLKGPKLLGGCKIRKQPDSSVFEPFVPEVMDSQRPTTLYCGGTTTPMGCGPSRPILHQSMRRIYAAMTVCCGCELSKSEKSLSGTRQGGPVCFVSVAR